MFVLLVGGFIFAAVQGARSFSEQAARSEIRFWLDCEVNLGTTQCTRSFGPLERRVDDCASNPLLGRDTCERLVREERAALLRR